MSPNPKISPDAYTSAIIVSNRILDGVLRQPYATPLDSLESRETCDLIIQAMTPTETIIAACRSHQLPDSVPAALLGITTDRVGQIMRQFKRRLIAQYPYLRVSIEGRRRKGQAR